MSRNPTKRFNRSDWTTGAGLLLVSVVVTLVLAEIVSQSRTSVDLAVTGVLVVVVAGALAVLRRAKSSLSASVAAHAELGTRLEQQQAVARIGQLALTDVPSQELLDEACRVVATALGADLVGVLELLPDRSAFVLQAGVGYSAEQLEKTVPAGSNSQGGYTLASSRPVIMHDARCETRFELSPLMVARGITSGVSVSIGWNDGAYGVLGAHTYLPREFSDPDAAFLETVGIVLASALRRRAAEAKAEQTHSVLEAVIEGTNDSVFVRDLDGRFIAINAVGAAALGRAREELIGQTVHQALPRPMADAIAEADQLTLARGTVETFEFTALLGGETRIYLTTMGPYRAQDGALVGVFGIAHDITVRKMQEQELAHSEESLRLAQDGGRVGTWDFDLPSGVTTWSDGLRTLCGVGLDDPAGFTLFSSLVHEDDREWVARKVEEAYTRGVNLDFECRIVRPDGELRWLLGRTSSLRNPSGVVDRVLGVAVDITDRKLAEEELMRSEETLRLAQAAGGFGAWDWQVDTGELNWTQGVYEIFGVDPATFEPNYETMRASIHADDREGVDAEIRRVLASGDSYYERPCRVVQPSGETRWVITRATLIRATDGSVKQMVGITLDETERRSADDRRAQLETRLRQAEKLEAVGQLAGGVAHDFNNLLVAIHGYGELALGRIARDESGAGEYIEAVLEAADRAGGLTKQLLAFGRRQVLSPEVLDLNHVVEKTDGLLQRLIGDNVELVTVLAERPVLVKADRGQLEQVIMNLAVNGRDAMPEGGVLTIRVATEDLERSTGGVALLSVTDEGSGIDAATASHIFEPFFSTKGDEGTGLGLATVHGIVAQSGGQITLETDPGRGTTFKVQLPLCAGEISPDVVKPASKTEGTETILLVEDDPSVRSIVSTMLADRGYAMTDAADGEEAIARFESSERPIQLVVSDLMMRGLTGQQTLDRIREIEPATKALYMSGYTDDELMWNGDIGHGTGFIQKPFTGNQLATRVRELLDGVIA